MMISVLLYTLFLVVSTVLICLSCTYRHPAPLLPFILLLLHYGLEHTRYVISFFSHLSTLYLSVYWLAILLLSVPSISYCARKKCKNTVILRKSFHLVVLLMFAPPIIQRTNLEFIAVSSVSVLAIMVIVETVRVCNLFPKFSAFVNKFFAPLLDQKDAKRTLVTSHMELLLAAVSAVWVNQAFPNSLFSWTESTRFLLCGLLTVGVGDSAAAIGGLNIGKPIKFPYSSKSLQGFISFIVSVLTILCIVSFVDTAAVIATIASALTEVYVERFDNIALPLVFAATLLICRTFLELQI